MFGYTIDVEVIVGFILGFAVIFFSKPSRSSKFIKESRRK